jgi:hypothetical protein
MILKIFIWLFELISSSHPPISVVSFFKGYLFLGLPPQNDPSGYRSSFPQARLFGCRSLWAERCNQRKQNAH